MSSLFSGNIKTVFAVGAASVAALGALFYYLNDSQECNDTLLPALELEMTQQIMTKILEKLKFIALKHSRAAQHIKMQLEQQGQQLPEEDMMRHFILPHFETAFEDAQTEVLEEFDADEEELEEATRFYAARGDGRLQEIVSKIQLMHKQFGGSNDGDGDGGSSEVAGKASQDMTLGEVIGILQTLSEKVGQATDRYVEEFKSVHGLPHSQDLMLQFQQGMLDMSEQMEAAVMSAYGVTQQDFQKSLMAHQHNEVLQQTVVTMQMQNQQRLAAHGIQLQ